jgi:hypothetical protein
MTRLYWRLLQFTICELPHQKSTRNGYRCLQATHLNRWCQEKVAKIVYYGLPQLHVALLGAYAPMLATRQ